MRTRWLAPVVLVLALLAPATVSAQRLGAVSGAVHGGGGGGGFGGGGGGGYRGGGYRGGSYSRSYGYGYGYGAGVGQVGYVSPWVSLYYPYYLGYSGAYVRQDSMRAEHTFDGPAVIGIVDASAGYVFDGVVHGQLSGRIRFSDILDIEARYGAYFEQTSDAIRELGIGRLSAAFNIVSEDAFQLRVGGAGLVYHDAAGAELGFAGLVEMDAYPVEPLVLRAEASVGSLGRAVFIDARATVGFQIDRGELYVGYQVFTVDPGQIDGTTLHGPIAGVRVWIS